MSCQLLKASVPCFAVMKVSHSYDSIAVIIAILLAKQVQFRLALCMRVENLQQQQRILLS